MMIVTLDLKDESNSPLVLDAVNIIAVEKCGYGSAVSTMDGRYWKVQQDVETVTGYMQSAQAERQREQSAHREALEGVTTNAGTEYGAMQTTTGEGVDPEGLQLWRYTVVIDIDGVIADTSHFEDNTLTWAQKFEQADVLPGAEKALRNLTRHQYLVILHTARPEEYRDLTVAWLKEHGIHDIGHYQELRCGKPCGILYVDDRGHRFDGWDGVFAALEETDAEEAGV